MFLSPIANLAATMPAATSDELQPWMIAAAVALLLLALVLIIIAARKVRKGRGDDIREALEASKQEASGASAEQTGPKHAAKKD